MRTIQKSNKLSNVCYDIRGPIMDRARQMEEDGQKIIKLNIGNLAVFGFDAPEEIQQDMIRNLPNSAGYSDSKGIFGARKAVMHETQRQGIKGVGLEDIYLGNGASELIVMATNGLLDDGDELLLPAPDYPLWTAAVSLSGGTPVHYLCDEANGWMPSISDIRKKITPSTKGIVVINPNNPTGNHFTHKELESLLRKAPRQCLVVVDEAYADYSTAKDFPHCLELMKRYPNLIVSRTFSKLYGLAGLRLGYGIGDAAIIRETLRVKTPFNLNLLVQTAALTALKDKAFVRRSLSVNQKGKKQLEAGFKKLGLFFLPTEANFICFRVPRPAVELCEDLMKRGMIMRPLKSFGLPDWCRVTIGTAEQNRFFLQELKSVL